jgi:hypothetical protein
MPHEEMAYVLRPVGVKVWTDLASISQFLCSNYKIRRILLLTPFNSSQVSNG